MDELENEIIESSSEVLEFGLDLFTKNPILKDFPILGVGVKIALAIKSLSDRVFLKKIERFVFKFNEITNIESEKILWKIRLDEKEKQRIGENLLFLIDRYADRDKPGFLASILALFIQKEITEEELLRIGNAIDLSFSPDLNDFLKEPNNQLVLNKLIRSGLCEVSRVGSIPTEQFGFNGVAVSHAIQITDIGKLFLKIK